MCAYTEINDFERELSEHGRDAVQSDRGRLRPGVGSNMHIVLLGGAALLFVVLACTSCGGQLDVNDGGVCTPDAVATGCACSQQGVSQDVDGGTCVCAVLQGCTGTRWACYDLPPECPAQPPVESSSCSNASLKCTYARADGTADELICDGSKWSAVYVTTFCK